MKIVYCIPAIYASGGMERVLSLKANYLTLQGHEVHIVITDGGDRPSYFPLETSIKIHQLGLDFEEAYRYSFLRRLCVHQLRMIKFKEKLNDCLCQIKPDITISMLGRDIKIINEMKDGSVKIGEVHFDRSHCRYFKASWMHPAMYAYIHRQWIKLSIRGLRKLSKFVVLTNEDAVCWPELQNVAVIPNPTSFFPDALSTCTQKQVIAAGRYVPQKGFDRLIVTWKKVLEKHPDWTLKIYGDGWMRKQLQQQIIAYGLVGYCSLEHTTLDIAKKLQESSMYVLSSRYEGFGLVIVEAMACGLPVVAFTCHCGPRDIISDGIDGLLIEDGDIDGLAENINRLIEDEELRREMGRMARLKADNYRIENVGNQWILLFENLLTNESK